MALQQLRTDDLNGDPDAETVVITINGQGIEIDLAARSTDKLVKALEPFWKVGTPAEYTVTRAIRGRKRTVNDKYDPSEVRAWANNTGVKVPARGRIPQAVVDQYLRS